MADVILFANPFGDCAGFTFRSVEELTTKAEKLKARGCEEYEVEFHDGNKADSQLFEALRKAGLVWGGNLETYFDTVVDLNEHDKAALFILATNGHYAKDDTLEDVLKVVDDEARCFQGDTEDYARELVSDIGVEGISNNEAYFDYEAFGNAMEYDLDESEEGDKFYLDMPPRERAEEYIDQMGGVKELGKKQIEEYFDYEALARDLDMGGDTVEFEFGGQTWVLTNANSL